MWLAQHDVSSIFVWLLVLVVLIVVGCVLVAWVRRRLNVQDDNPSGGFTLSDLRELRRQGKMSEEEFERAKSAMLASMRAGEAARKVPPKE
ncbi:MAG: SHOCT domain-containing protein [Tepidisphaerales bacterium]